MCCIFAVFQLILMTKHVYSYWWPFVGFGDEEEKNWKGILLNQSRNWKQQLRRGSMFGFL